MEIKTAEVNRLGTRNELNAKKGQWSAKTHSPKQSSRIEPGGGGSFSNQTIRRFENVN